jgi:hypothetical protein
MQSIDSLRELNAKLLAEIGELRKKFAEIKVENDELKDKNTEIPELRRKFAEIEAERAELKARIAELLKQAVEENKMRDARVKKLEQKNTELEARLAIVEQGDASVTGPPENEFTEVNMISVVDVSNSVVDQLKQHTFVCKANDVVSEVLPEVNSKSSEEREVDAFLDDAYKKSVSDGIRQHNKKKLLLESAQDSSPVTSDLSRETETIISNHQQEDAKTVTKCHDQNSVLGDSDTTSEVPESENQIVEGLVQELFCVEFGSASSNEGGVGIAEISKPCLQDMVLGSAQSLSDLFDKAIKTGQKQILCWFYYTLEFENKVRNLTADGKIKDKMARSKIYKEMKPFLPNITDVNLRKKTERARKILKLIGEGGVGVDRIKFVTYSASTISGLKDAQIQYIVNQVTSKTVTKCHDYTTTKITNGNQTSAFIPLNAKINTSANVLSASFSGQSNPSYDRTYFRNKTLDQYPNLYREFSSENFNYYGITDKTSCPLCKLDHDDEKGIEGRYEARSYFIKCEQHEIEIVA